jgi:4-hydroxymandelate oxidase
MENRRRFLAYLASSPLLAAQDLNSYVIADPKEAINVLDFEAAAKKVLPPAHFGYLTTGVDDDVSLRANREGFNRFYLRPRRLVDISKPVDMRTQIFGMTWDTPIGLAPIGNTKAFHAEGEIPVARAASVKNIHQIVSTNANTSVEQMAETRGAPVWYQLYCPPNWSIAERLVRRAEAAGSPVLALTVDTQAGRRTETFEKYKRLDKRDCVACHGTTREAFYIRKPMFRDIDMKGVSAQDPAMTWQLIGKLRKLTSMKLLVKGIEVGEDAKLCIESGADGVIVSNHGGRAGDTGRGTIECLPEVIEAVGGKVPVFIDGGFRRGSDVFKALALGARAVFIGRPYIWGLAAFGQPGVERVLDLLRLELELVMKQCGTRSVAEITRAYVGSHPRA